MRRRFIAKRNKNLSLFFKIFFLFIIGLFILSKIMSFKLFETNSNLISYVMESSNHLIETDLTYTTKLVDLSILLTNIDVKKTSNLFQNNFIYENKISNINEPLDYDTKPIFESLIKKFDSIEVPTVKMENNLPRVYIYNTHQTEEYIIENNSIHNLTPNVYTASYMLKDMLEKKNIKTIVEDGNISDYLNNNNLNYDDSYIASRYYLEQAISKYPSVELFIDLHRDALNHATATAEHDGKNYAKILFVVGLEHNNYKQNLDLANELNNLILNNYNFLTRGVLTKEGPLVNGIYNQDLNNRVVLLEVGGNESTLDEVSNTLELISEIIYKKLGENNV